jgi:hypothetical protein
VRDLDNKAPPGKLMSEDRDKKERLKSALGDWTENESCGCGVK